MMKKNDFNKCLHQEIYENPSSIKNAYDLMNNQNKNTQYDQKLISKIKISKNIVFQNNLNLQFATCPNYQDPKNYFNPLMYENLYSNLQNYQLYNSTNAYVKENSQIHNTSNFHPKKNPFTSEEDELLLRLVKLFGIGNWQKISVEMKKYDIIRNGRQCRDRYCHYLDPNIDKNSNWTPDEDNLLLKTVRNNGTKWKIMENMFPGRTEVSLRNRYNLLVRKERKEQKLNSKNDKKIQESQVSTNASKQINANIKSQKSDLNLNSLDDSIYESFADESLNFTNDFEYFEF